MREPFKHKAASFLNEHDVEALEDLDAEKARLKNEISEIVRKRATIINKAYGRHRRSSKPA